MPYVDSEYQFLQQITLPSVLLFTFLVHGAIFEILIGVLSKYVCP